MSPADTNSLKAGDVVLVRATVQEPRSAGRYGWMEVCGISGVPIRHEHIVSVEPRPLAVGEKVSIRGCSGKIGEIRALDGNDAWVLFEDERRLGFDLTDLVRA